MTLDPDEAVSEAVRSADPEAVTMAAAIDLFRVKFSQINNNSADVVDVMSDHRQDAVEVSKLEEGALSSPGQDQGFCEGPPSPDSDTAQSSLCLSNTLSDGGDDDKSASEHSSPTSLKKVVCDGGDGVYDWPTGNETVPSAKSVMATAVYVTHPAIIT